MKLLLCENCFDVFKLDYEKRSCKCGRVSGQYMADGSSAINNGQGVSLALGNGSVIQAIQDMRSHQRLENDQADRSSYYQDGAGLISYAWVRPNEGPGNPHSKVVSDAA